MVNDRSRLTALRFFGAAALLGLTASSAEAAMVDLTFSFTATDFVSRADGSIGPDLSGIVSISFDNSADISNNASDVSVLSSSLGSTSGYTLGYEFSTDSVIISANSTPRGCSFGDNQFCLVVGNISTNATKTTITAYQIGSVVYDSGRRAVLSPAPEPATWALMVSGMGAIGFSLRRGGKDKRRACA